jgi:translation initiation factor 1 (eIF-1/SUI1)
MNSATFAILVTMATVPAQDTRPAEPTKRVTPIDAMDREEIDLARALREGTGCAGCVIDGVIENADFSIAR